MKKQRHQISKHWARSQLSVTRVFPSDVCRINPHRACRADFHVRPETGTLRASHSLSQ